MNELYIKYELNKEKILETLELYGFRKEYTEFYLQFSTNNTIYDITTVEIDFLNTIIDNYEKSEWYESDIPIHYYTTATYNENEINKLLQNHIFNKIYNN